MFLHLKLFWTKASTAGKMDGRSFRLSVLLLCVIVIAQCQDTPKSCGKSGDITNIGILHHARPVFAGNSTFETLSKVCYGKIKTSLEELKGSVIEKNSCAKKFTAVITELKSLCSTLKRAYSFNTMFQASLSSLNKIHKEMEYISKFAEIVPAVGKMRKLVMEKVLPMAIEALEYAFIGVRNVVVYFRKFLGQTDSDDLEKLLTQIQKIGTKACIDSTTLGKHLTKVDGELKSSRESSHVLLQAMFEIQTCANKECPSRPEDCLECWKLNNNFGNAHSQITKWKEGMQDCSKKMDKVIDQLNVTDKLNAIFDIGFNTTTEIDQFLKILSGSLAKSVKSITPVEKHLLACCPCGRTNPKGCDEEAIKKSTGSVICPLELLKDFKITNLLQSIEKKVEKLRFTLFPDVNLDIYISPTNFQKDVPKYIQECFGSSSFKMKFTKLCSLPTEEINLKFRSPILPGLRQSSIALTYSSLSEEIKLSCTKVLDAFKHSGRTMTECGDRIAIATSTCSKLPSEPDSEVDYCPCQIPPENADAKQPYCAVWKKSDLKTCPSHCLDKGFKPGKNPGGHNAQMDKTYGYPVCDNLKYYCRVSDVRVRNGTVKCASEYTFHDGKCQIVPNPGFICPIDVIECGSSGDPIKGVCWNYNAIECSKYDGKHYPVCTCSNNDTFNNGKLLCQYGNSQGVAPTPDSALDLRKTSNCFERLGLDEDIKKDCGASMSPCIIQKPVVSPYEICSRHYSIMKATQQKDEDYKRSVIRGGIALTSIGAILLFALFLGCIIFLYAIICAEINTNDYHSRIGIIALILLVLLPIFIIPGPIMLGNPEIFEKPSAEVASFSVLGVALIFIIALWVILLKKDWEQTMQNVILCAMIFFVDTAICSLILGIVSAASPTIVAPEPIVIRKEPSIYLKVAEIMQ